MPLGYSKAVQHLRKKHGWSQCPVGGRRDDSKFPKNQCFLSKYMATKDAFLGSGVSWLVQITMIMLGTFQPQDSSAFSMTRTAKASSICSWSSLPLLESYSWAAGSSIRARQRPLQSAGQHYPVNVSGSARVNELIWYIPLSVVANFVWDFTMLLHLHLYM